MLDLPPASKHTTIDWSQVEQKPAIQPPSDAETGTVQVDCLVKSASGFFLLTPC